MLSIIKTHYITMQSILLIKIKTGLAFHTFLLCQDKTKNNLN